MSLSEFSAAERIDGIRYHCCLSFVTGDEQRQRVKMREEKVSN